MEDHRSTHSSLRLVVLLNILALAFAWGYTIAVFPHVGTHVPTHFGISGVPDRYSDNATSIFIIPGIGTFIFLLIVSIAFGLAALGVRPNVYGCRLADSAKVRRVWHVTQTQLLLLSLLILLACDSLTVATALIAQGRLTTLTPWWLPVFLVLIVAQSVNMVIQLARTR